MNTFVSTYNLPSGHQYTIFPGFCDVHVHFRQPGFSFKETISTGSMAAAHGGFTAVCTMPNLNPVPDSLSHLISQTSIIDRDATVHIFPYGSVTVAEQGTELSDMEALAPMVIAFSDDGRGVQSEALMREAMLRAKSVGRMIVAHCEDNSLLHGGYIHDGSYAHMHGHRGICSESEWRQIERDLSLAAETGCPYHVCHISCKESVELIRRAKASGVDVTCETAPHYLLLTDEDLREDGRFKMNPPLRTADDRSALIEGLLDSTIDMIATDHAPHTAEEKSHGLEGSPFGIVGLETAFPLLYTHLVRKNILSLDKLIDLIAYNPRRRFNIPLGDGDFTVWDLSEETVIDPDDFLSMGHATPFAGEHVYGRCYLTVSDHSVAYIKEE